MDHRFQILTWVWLGGIALQVSLAAVIMARKVWTKFPFFAAYILANLSFNGFLYFVVQKLHATPRVYFRCYWITEGITLMLGLAAVFEIFTGLLASYPGLRNLAVLIFRCTVFVLFVFGAVVMIVQPQGDRTANAPYLMLETAVRIGEVGLVAFLFVFAGVFGLHWRQSAFGIAMGMGTFSIVQLVAVALQSYVGGRNAEFASALANLLAFDISLLIWLRCVLLPKQAIRNAEAPERAELEQLNKALTELIYQ